MEMFVAEVHRSHTDVRGRILSQLIDSAASGKYNNVTYCHRGAP